MAPQREWFEKDYYKVSGRVRHGDREGDHTRLPQAGQAVPPRRQPGHPRSGSRRSRPPTTCSATPAKRKEYDEVRRLGPAGNPFAGVRRRAAGAARRGTFRVDDLGDLLGNIFGRGNRRAAAAGAPRPAPSGPGAGQDLEAELHLSFLDAVDGRHHHGQPHLRSGAATPAAAPARRPGPSPVICPVCGGRGVINDNQGLFSFSQPCQNCGGTGMRVEHPCPTCHGAGVERRARQVKVRIPAGVEDGQRIRIKGRGGAGRGGGPAGDLYVVVHTDRHPVFGRQGQGPHPDRAGQLPRGGPGRHRHRADPRRAGDGQGAGREQVGPDLPGPGPRRARRRAGVGDLLVTIEVAVPEQLTDAERGSRSRRWRRHRRRRLAPNLGV